MFFTCLALTPTKPCLPKPSLTLCLKLRLPFYSLKPLVGPLAISPLFMLYPLTPNSENRVTDVPDTGKIVKKSKYVVRYSECYPGSQEDAMLFTYIISFNPPSPLKCILLSAQFSSWENLRRLDIKELVLVKPTM